MTSSTEDSSILVNHFHDIGRFLAIARRIDSVSTRTDLCMGIVDKTELKSLCSRLAETFGVSGRLIQIRRGAPRKHNPDKPGGVAPARISLTKAGELVVARLEEIASRCRVRPAGSTRVAVAYEAGAMLEPLARGITMMSRVDQKLVNPTSFDGLEQAVCNPFRPAVGLCWMGKGNRLPPQIKFQRLVPHIPLGIVAASARALSQLRPSTEEPLLNIALLARHETVAVPKFLSEFDGLDRSLLRMDTFAEVLSAVLTGTVRFGVVPDVPAVLDPLRRAGLLWFGRSSGLPSDTVSLVLTTGYGEGGVATQRIKRALGVELSRLAPGSPLDNQAIDRELPKSPSAYHGRFTGYFVEVYEGNHPIWQKEELKLETAAVEPGTVIGSEAIRVTGGQLNSPSGDRFALTGGVFSNLTLYLVAHSINRRDPPVSFLCVFPYHLTQWSGRPQRKGESVFLGFWFGRDKMNHPVVSPIIISRLPLAAADLRAISESSSMRTLFVADAFNILQSKPV